MAKTIFNNKKDIIDWLNEHDIRKYTLVPNDKYGYVVDVATHVDLHSRGFTFIPVKFNHIKGHFKCYSNQLTHLDFSPQRVEGLFGCSDNLLVSLEGGPQSVGDSFDCSNNLLTDLKGSPTQVVDFFCCASNRLTTLEGGPHTVFGEFYASHNELTSLKGCPYRIDGDFDFSHNQLLSLEYFPQIFHGVDCSDLSNQDDLRRLLQKKHSYLNFEYNPHLGDIQTMTDFYDIYSFHKNIVDIKKEKKDLSQTIDKKENKAFKTHKI